MFLDDIGRNLKAARALGMTTIKVDEPERALAELARHLSSHWPRPWRREPPRPLREEARRLAALAVPVALSQLAIMSMGFVDLVVVGRVSVEAFAAVGAREPLAVRERCSSRTGS